MNRCLWTSLALIFLWPVAATGYASILVETVSSDLTPARDAVVRASVKRSNGRPVVGLSAPNFSATVDGQSAKTVDVVQEGERRPIAVVLAVDVSRSMAGERIASARELAGAFLDELSPDDLVSFITFGQDTYCLADYTTNKDYLKRIAADLRPEDRGTLLHSAILACVRKAEKAPFPRVVVLLLSDGKDEGSSVTFSQAIRVTEKVGVPFYTIGLGTEADMLTLRRLSELTGGLFWRSPSPDGLALVHDQIRQDLVDEYVITIEGPLESGKRTLQLMASLGGETSSTTATIMVPVETVPEEKANGHSWPLVVLVSVPALALVAVIATRMHWSSNSEYDEEEVMLMEESSGASGGWIDLDNPPKERRRGRVWLEVMVGSQAGTKLELQGRTVHIGRDSRSELALKNDPAASRRHAQVSFDRTGEFVLCDLESANGTKVNGHSLETRSVRLRDGDRITVGASEIVYRDTRPRFQSR